MWIRGCICCWARPPEAVLSADAARKVMDSTSCYSCGAREATEKDYKAVLKIVKKYEKIRY